MPERNCLRSFPACTAVLCRLQVVTWWLRIGRTRADPSNRRLEQRCYLESQARAATLMSGLHVDSERLARSQGDQEIYMPEIHKSIRDECENSHQLVNGVGVSSLTSAGRDSLLLKVSNNLGGTPGRREDVAKEGNSASKTYTMPCKSCSWLGLGRWCVDRVPVHRMLDDGKTLRV